MVVTFQVQVDPLDKSTTFDVVELKRMQVKMVLFVMSLEQITNHEYIRSAMFVDDKKVD